MFTVITVLVYEFIILIKKDPDFWLIARTNKEYMKHWDHLEKSQPKQNTAILTKKRRKNPDQVTVDKQSYFTSY